LKTRSLFVSFGALAAIALIASGCRGPRDPLEVSVREFPTDVILGSQGVAVQVPSPQAEISQPVAPLIISRAPVAAARPRQQTQTAAPSGPCPAAHPFDAPKDEAPARATFSPFAAIYPYRNSGTYEYKQGTTANAGAIPAQSTRAIKDVTRPGTNATTGYQFKVAETLAGVTTTTTYAVVPESSIPGEAGVFISRIETIRGGVPNEDFQPQPRIKILEFPLMANLNWKSSGADPRNGISMTIQGRVGIEIPDGQDAGTEPDILARARVDACGEVIDAWLVEIGGPSSGAAPDPAGGTFAGPNKDLRLKAVHAIATQFGAFSMYDKYQTTGTDRGQTVKLINEATISQLPKLS
jgi:hypothetical protein